MTVLLHSSIDCVALHQCSISSNFLLGGGGGYSVGGGGGGGCGQFITTYYPSKIPGNLYGTAAWNRWMHPGGQFSE